MNDCYADLHLHTTASDGTQAITELVRRATACGLSCIAITDHDTISPHLKHRTTRIGGLEVITGVELKVDFDGIQGELLGYFIDPRKQAINELFQFMKRARETRMKEMVKRCREELNIAIEMDEVRKLAKGSLGRPHLAQLLVDKLAAPSLREAFDRHIGEGGTCYVPLKRPDFRTASAAIHNAGGITSIPHPCFMHVEDWETFLFDVRDAGVDGIEAFYPYTKAVGRLSITPEHLRKLAKQAGFLLSGGSDDHGPGSVKETLGSVKLPCHYVEKLRRACG
jgi:hypothetical protein